MNPFLKKIMRRPRPFLAALLLVLFCYCSFKKPQAPSWDVELPIPLIDETFTVAELLEDQDFLTADSTGLVTFSLEEKIKRFNVGDSLKIQSLSKGFEAELGEFTIREAKPQGVSIQLKEIWPEASTRDGHQIAVPPFSFPSLSKDIPEFPEFFSITFASGRIEITLFNNLAIPIGPIEIVLKRSDTGSIIDELAFPEEIAPGDSSTQSMDLSGKTIPNRLRVEMQGGSPGSEGEVVTIDAESSFRVQVSIANVKAVEALAQIPAQRFSGNDTVTVKDSIITVTEAVIDSGSIFFTLTSSFDLDVDIKLKVPDILSPYGDTLTIPVYIPANGTFQQMILLDDYTFKPHQEQRVSFSWEAQTRDTREEIVTIRSGDYIRVQVELSELRFSRIKGVLNSLRRRIDPQVKEIDLPSGLKKLSFKKARLEFKIKNGVGFPIKPNLLILGRDGSGGSVPFPIQEEIPASPGPGLFAETFIIFNETNSNILDFLNLPPREVEISGEVFLGEEGVEGSVTKHDFIEAEVKVSAPLILSFLDQEIETDVNEVKIEEDTRETIRENLQSGEMILEIDNHLPVGASIEFCLDLVDSLVFTSPDLVIGPVVIEPAETAPNSGKVSQTVTSETTIELTKQDLKIFENPSVFTGVRISIPATDVEVYNTDFLRVKACAIIKYRVDSGDEGR